MFGSYRVYLTTNLVGLLLYVFLVLYCFEHRLRRSARPSYHIRSTPSLFFMMWKSLSIFLGPVVLAAKATAHIAFYDPSMWGFNVTAQSYSYDNRPMVPLMDLTFEEWWFHGHLDHPPHDGDLFELPAGGAAISQLACNKGATKFWASSEGTTDIRQGDYPCPNSPLSAFHGLSDVKGCALAITYNSDVNSVNPEDFAVFSVNQTCVWSVSTEFQVPASMPKCPPGGCICAWFWIHSVDSGSEQMYMNGFRCDVTGATGTKPIGAAKVPRRCGAEPDIGKAADLSNCTTGPKQPLYWFQKERNNMFEGQYSPPYYNDLYHFLDGAQNDIFVDGSSSPSPSSSVSSPVASSSGPALVVLPSSSSSHVSYSMFSSSSRPSSSVVDASKPAPSVGTTTTSVADPSDIPCDSDVESSTGYSPSSHSYPSPTSIPSQNADPSDIPCDSDTDDSPSSHEHHSPKHHSPTSTTSPVADPSDVPCDEDGGSSTSSHPHGHPSPSSKPRARSSEQKRRQNLVSRHFKRRLSREHRI